MRKHIFLGFIALFLSSCTLTRMNKSYRAEINGRWILNSITYSGNSGEFKSKLFDEADAGCFEGSLWTFNSNNSIGSYTLGSKANCPSLSRQLRWSVYGPGDTDMMLQFKRIDPSSKKSLEEEAGYRLYIDQLDPTRMRLRTTITFEGKPFNILYNFTKN